MAEDLTRVEKAQKIYELSTDLWFKVSPYRHSNRGHPGVGVSYSDELAFIESAITALQEAKEGLMEEAFPKLKEVRKEQERYWDRVTPGDK